MISQTGEHGISRFSRMEFPYMPWFFDRAGSDDSFAYNAALDVAFRTTNSVGTPEEILSRLNSPAYTYPYQRFAAPLRNANA